MSMAIDYDPSMQRYGFYYRGGGYAFYLGDRRRDEVLGPMHVHERVAQPLDTGTAARPFLILEADEYRAMADAILVREAPMLAEKNMLQSFLTDTQQVRDRMIALIEKELDR